MHQGVSFRSSIGEIHCSIRITRVADRHLCAHLYAIRVRATVVQVDLEAVILRSALPLHREGAVEANATMKVSLSMMRVQPARATVSATNDAHCHTTPHNVMVVYDTSHNIHHEQTRTLRTMRPPSRWSTSRVRRHETQFLDDDGPVVTHDGPLRQMSVAVKSTALARGYITVKSLCLWPMASCIIRQLQTASVQPSWTRRTSGSCSLPRPSPHENGYRSGEDDLDFSPRGHNSHPFGWRCDGECIPQTQRSQQCRENEALGKAHRLINSA